MIRTALAFFVVLVAAAQGGIEFHDYADFCRERPDRDLIVVTPAHAKAALLLVGSPRYAYCNETKGLAGMKRLYAMQYAAVPSAAEPIPPADTTGLARRIEDGVPVILDGLDEAQLASLRSRLAKKGVQFKETVLAPDLIFLRQEPKE